MWSPSDAPSVVTDNFDGAYQLTQRIISAMPGETQPPGQDNYFIGGSINDHATAGRINGFQDALKHSGLAVLDDHIIQCGYVPDRVALAMADLHLRLGTLPSGLFVNSFTAFEGVMSHFVNLPPSAFDNSTIGCFDYDPFASFLRFPVFMVWQDSRALMAKAYELLDRSVTTNEMHVVKPQLIEPRTIAEGSIPNLG